MSSDLAKLIAAADNAWPGERVALLVFAGVNGAALRCDVQ
jgi:hypothetical protein